MPGKIYAATNKLSTIIQEELPIFNPTYSTFSRKVSGGPTTATSEVSSSNSSVDSDTEETDDNLIHKPSGEAGRPGRGGYNLKEIMERYGWSAATFKERRAFVNKLVTKNLDCGVSYTFQDNGALKRVFKLAIERYPEFGEFQGAWPLADILRSTLKYKASQTKKRKNRVLAERYEEEKVE